MNTLDVNRIMRKKLKSSALYEDLQDALTRMCNKLIAMTDGAKSPMNKALSSVIASGGKRLRPILAFICYRMGGNTETDILPLMCMLELMHTASLIHDDIVDSADKRRDIPTINSVSGNFAAAQSGDFLLAKAMELLHVYRGTGINEMLADVSYQMCMGELSQQRMRFDFGAQAKETYFELITGKTAMLFAACCWCGATAGGMSREDAGRLYRYGERLGIAFQMQDDLLDYSDKSGKAAGQDLRNGIFTLPILELLEAGVSDSVNKLIYKRNKSEDEVLRLTEYVKNTGVTGHVKAAIKTQLRAAALELRGLPPGPEKSALIELALSLAKRQI